MAESEIKTKYEAAASMMRVQGILAIVFGGLGAMISLFVMLLFTFAITEYNSYQVISSFIMGFLVLIFGVLPHAYLIFSGIQLIKNPKPSVAKTLTIINLIVGVLYNWITLIFAIITLTQLHDYEKGYKKN